MGSPDQPNSVGDAVIGVVQQIDTNDRDHPGVPPVGGQLPGGKVGIDCGITEQGKGLPAGGGGYRNQPHRDAGHRVAGEVSARGGPWLPGSSGLDAFQLAGRRPFENQQQ